jgi:hypothetical protein
MERPLKVRCNSLDDDYVEVTSICPHCEQEFSRMMWFDGVIAGCAIELCDACGGSSEFFYFGDKRW